MAGLYVHIPFCKQRCIYCDFYFVTSQKLASSFVSTLLAEIAFWGTFFGPKPPIDTIYFGGGTPSRLPVAQISMILEAIDTHFDTQHVRERTFEINPDDVEKDYLPALRQTGIDRLSIGIQSFFEDDLQWMNRAHTAEQASSIIDKARSAGFEKLSADLIFGLPSQPESQWRENLEKAIALDIPHLSTYSLTVEPQTPLHKQVTLGRETPVSEHLSANLYQYTMDRLREAGYEHYEVSSFCKPSNRSEHNQQYWQHTNYIGLGPSAHSFWHDEEKPATRWANVRSLKQYVAWDQKGKPPLAFEEQVSATELANEHIMLRLRTREGLSLTRLEEHYGVHVSKPLLDRFISDDMATIDENQILSLTDKGLLVCDTITEALMQ